MLAPESNTRLPPGGAVTVPLQPPPVKVAFAGLATTRSGGRRSARLPPVSARALASVLPMVRAMVDVSPVSMASGVKDFARDTAVWTRTSVALAGLPLVTPWAVVTAPAASVFVLEPLVPGAVTFTWTEHVVGPAPSVPPASENVPAPAFAVTVPPQVLVTPGVVDTTCPAAAHR